MLVRIENLTQKTTIMRNGQVANNPWAKLSGLIGTKQLDRRDGSITAPHNGERGMYLSASVDIMYVDTANRVIALDERMLPDSGRKPQSNCSYIVELPVGAIALSKTNVGDLLQTIYQGIGVRVAHDMFTQ